MDTEKDRLADEYYQNEYGRNQPDENQLEPPPHQINTETGKCMWVINGYRIWANSYKEALELLPLIESF